MDTPIYSLTWRATKQVDVSRRAGHTHTDRSLSTALFGLWDVLCALLSCSTWRVKRQNKNTISNLQSSLLYVCDFPLAEKLRYFIRQRPRLNTDWSTFRSSVVNGRKERIFCFGSDEHSNNRPSIRPTTAASLEENAPPVQGVALRWAGAMVGGSRTGERKEVNSPS